MTVAGVVYNNQDAINTIPDAEPIIASLQELVGSSNLNADQAVIQIRAAALFTRLKALNRASNAAARACKQATTEARAEMDSTHLGLQNLQYEKRHLEREIEKCKQFGSIYQDISMHTIEEFKELAPEELRTEEVLENEHQLTLNMLSFELAERQRLEQKRKDLAQKKEEMIKMGKNKAVIMDNVKLQIDVLSKAAGDVQKKVNDLVKPIMASTPQS